LPAHLVPARFVVLAALPLTPSGKLDRQRLPEPGDPSPADRRAYVAPRSALETLVTSMWHEVLDAEHVGIHDGFFALGGHSLAAMRLLARLRDALGIELPFRAFFAGPTVEQMAAALQAREARPGSLERIAQITLNIQAMSADEVQLAATRIP
ncbi:MAG TPA: phosphopantetheine-binding protein, partial [Candidatus Lustribacter sp.]